MRALGCLLVIGATLLSLVALLAAIEPFYHSSEERDAFRAFQRFRESPSPETEEAYEAARDKAWRKELKFRGAAALIGGIAGIGAGFGVYRLRRDSRRRAGASEGGGQPGTR